MRSFTECRSQRDAQARITKPAPAMTAECPATGLTTAELRQIVLEILG